METVQIELTNACINQCSNCTRFVGHVEKPFFMPVEQVAEGVDSLKGFLHMIGVMGGEPLLHPQFSEICKVFREKVPFEKAGLWTCLPEGKEHYREEICSTFGNIFINDHSRDDIYHCPALVAGEEVFKGFEDDQWYIYDHCWLQRCWSASINPNGAFFCEVAAAMSILFDIKAGWEVKPGWWKRAVKDYKEQIETFCPKCGVAIPLEKRRSTDGRDDISKGNYERLKDTSPKIKAGKYVIHDLRIVRDSKPLAAYKEEGYRKDIAARYGMFLVLNDSRYQTPYLKKNWRRGDEEKEEQSIA
ncbi:MAG: radical SAM protein [Dehalococcoidia bacterium]|jgi:hypothetical protein|nr:radical SAM protein [Dehalococcoidia bacterium]